VLLAKNGKHKYKTSSRFQTSTESQHTYLNNPG